MPYEEPLDYGWCRCLSGRMHWFTVAALVLGLGLLVAGGVCLPQGLEQREVVNKMDASKDFVLLLTECTITGIQHWTVEGADQKSCKDAYKYSFTTPIPYTTAPSTTTELQSKNEFKLRDGHNSCAQSTARPNTWVKGDKVKCWKATPEVSRDLLDFEEGAQGDQHGDDDKPYKCGNPSCLKIFDPSDEASAFQDYGMELMNIGGALLGIGGLIFLVGSIFGAISFPIPVPPNNAEETKPLASKASQTSTATIITSQDLPAMLGERVYNHPGAFNLALGMFMAGFSPFFGVFFGIKGPDGEWPYAWWSFCFIFNGIGMMFAVMSNVPVKVVRTPDAFVITNWLGKLIPQHAHGPTLPLSSIETVASKQGCCGRYITLTFTDECVAQMKEKAGCRACCCSLKTLDLNLVEYQAFLQDHGLHPSQVVTSDLESKP